jgi:hypothetical protein
MDALEAINQDLNADEYERAGIHRWVKNTPEGQLQVQAGAELRDGRMAVFTGRFRENEIVYTVGGSWRSDTGEYVALMEVLSGGDAQFVTAMGRMASLCDLLRDLSRRAHSAFVN